MSAKRIEKMMHFKHLLSDLYVCQLFPEISTKGDTIGFMLYTYAEGKLLDSSERPLKGTPTKMGVLTIEGDFDKDYFTIYSHALGMHVTLFSGDYASIDRWIKQLVMEKKLEK